MALLDSLSQIFELVTPEGGSAVYVRHLFNCRFHTAMLLL
jgi:hypothetical protein